MPELGLSSTYDYSTATSNRKKSIFLVIGVTKIHTLSSIHRAKLIGSRGALFEIFYDHTVNMSHLGRSGTLLDPPNTLVSIFHSPVLTR